MCVHVCVSPALLQAELTSVETLGLSADSVARVRALASSVKAGMQDIASAGTLQVSPESPLCAVYLCWGLCVCACVCAL